MYSLHFYWTSENDLKYDRASNRFTWRAVCGTANVPPPPPPPGLICENF